MRPEEIELAVKLGSFVLLLALGWGVGSAIERRHLADLRRRELRSRRMIVTNLRQPPPAWRCTHAGLVAGSCVISIDYYKRVAASLRTLVGGRVRAYEPLLERARREAVLRMKEEAQARGYAGILNLRIETSTIAAAGRNPRAVAGVEILAYGTGVAFTAPAAAPRSGGLGAADAHRPSA